ncbi:hypothetical protein [Nostoc sp.]|uniref:hypothetical protein n=1 Tax=Nostoc sp. TaxID=1180 RepID=UPI003FA56F1D
MSNSTISRVLTRLGLTRKKKRSMPVKNKPNEFKIYGESTDNKSIDNPDSKLIRLLIYQTIHSLLITDN